MENRCTKCGGELISGTLRSRANLYPSCFTPLEDLNRISARNLDVLCDLCTRCALRRQRTDSGGIENLRVEDLGKLQKR